MSFLVSSFYFRYYYEHVVFFFVWLEQLSFLCVFFFSTETAWCLSHFVVSCSRVSFFFSYNPVILFDFWLMIGDFCQPTLIFTTIWYLFLYAALYVIYLLFICNPNALSWSQFSPFFSLWPCLQKISISFQIVWISKNPSPPYKKFTFFFLYLFSNYLSQCIFDLWYEFFFPSRLWCLCFYWGLRPCSVENKKKQT